MYVPKYVGKYFFNVLVALLKRRNTIIIKMELNRQYRKKIIHKGKNTKEKSD